MSFLRRTWNKAKSTFNKAKRYVVNTAKKVANLAVKAIDYCVDKVKTEIETWKKRRREKRLENIREALSEELGYLLNVIDELAAENNSLKEALEAKVNSQNKYFAVFTTIQVLLKKAKNLIESSLIQDLEDFSRLRISTNFLEEILEKINKNTDIDELTIDDVEFLRLVKKFMDFSFLEEEKELFNKLVIIRYGKKVEVLGAEELLSLWKETVEEDKNDITNLNDKISYETMQMGFIKNELDVENLTNAEKNEKELMLSRYEANINFMKKELEVLEERLKSEESILNATEGLDYLLNNKHLMNDRILEKSELVGNLLARWEMGGEPSIQEKIEIDNFGLRMNFIKQQNQTKNEVEGEINN